MNKESILSYLLLVLLGGCVPSLHPLYTDETLIFEEKLIGKWSEKGNDTIWEFRKAGENKYEVRVFDSGSGGRFEGHLVNLEGELFLDLYPEELDMDDDFYKLHFVRAHTFLRVSQLDPNLQLAMMNPDIIEDEPNVLKHERTDDSMVLTASTEELQKFMINHANDANAFDPDAAVMVRRIALYCDQDIIFDEKLTGMWEGKDGQILDSVRGENAYEALFVNEDGDECEFAAQLVELKGVKLLGIFFDASSIESPDPYGLHLIPDYFIKIDQIEPRLLLRKISYEEVASMLEQGPKLSKNTDEKEQFFFDGEPIESYRRHQ